MTEAAPSATAQHFRKLRLRTFVAWSLVAHFGAGISWGVPALLAKQAEMDLEKTRKELSDYNAKEVAKAKTYAKEQRTETTRKQVDEQLKSQFEKLTPALSEAKREALWKELAQQLANSERNFANALANADISEQDLRNLEAQLQREMVEALDRKLAAATADDMAAEFIAQVDNQVAPDLAKWMQEQVRDRVAQQLRNQADALVRDQREAANRERDTSVNAARDARDRTAEADDIAKRDREDGKRSEQRLQESAQRLDRAAKQLASAAERSPDLGSAAQEKVAAARDAVTKAQQAVAEAKSATAAAEPKSAKGKAKEAAAPPPAADAEAAQSAKSDAVAKADAALAAARQATSSAVETLEKADGREQLAKSELRKAADGELKAATEKAFTEEFKTETVPRLTPKLAQAFKEKLQQSGIDDPKLVEQVAAKAGELLAAKVPELAKAGDQVEQRFSDMAPPPAAGSDAAKQADAPKAIDTGLAAKGGAKTDLDRKLEAGKDKLLADAKGKVEQVAKDGRKDGDVVKLAKGDGKGDDAGLDMRERIGRMAEGMRNGRVGGLGASGLSGLRQGALQRGVLFTDGRSIIDRALYEKTAAEIANRGLQQGEVWQQSGASGEASQAQRTAGLVPARAAGQDNAQAKTESSNTHPYQPAFKSLAFTPIPCLPGDFAIDGKPDKWKDIAAAQLKPEHGNDPAVQLMQLGWRADGIYARFAVKDPDHNLSKTNTNAFWVGDTVEVWIDCLNSKEKYRARHAGQQFWIWPDGSLDDPSATGGESVVEKRGGWYQPHNLHQAELQRATTMTADGYITEFRIPAERLVDADFAPGRIIGFNAYVSTKSSCDWFWSAGKDAGTYGQPDTWGDLLLAGSDATIELANRARSEKAAGPELLMPGQPIKLRVVDGDMNLSPTRRDKVMVTLKPAHGAQQVVVMEETGEASGIFEGSTSTALALGDDQPGSLAVYEGERVDAVYLDQARANGARNAEVKLQLRFATSMVARIAPQ